MTPAMDATLTLMRWADRYRVELERARNLPDHQRAQHAGSVERSALAAEIRDVARRRLSEATGHVGHQFDARGFCRTCWPTGGAS